MQLKKKIGTAVLFKDNIFQNENVSSPFVLGIIRPKIYIPFNMNDQDLEHVVAHEEAHIQRKDHWWKPLGFFLLTIHWFNPLMWLAYVLLCRDIEFACDEKVIKELGNEQRADYTQALVACSIRRRSIAACPLAFGEVGVKERVKSVMKYKKPTIIVVLLALLTCVIVAVCFLTNPRRDSFDIRIVVPAGSQESFVYSDEEISPLRDYVIISAETLTPHQPMVLKPVEIKQENIYEPIYAIHGFPVKTTAEKGAWFKIGINVQNPTDQDLVVYVNVKYVEVRISDGDRTSLEENGSGTYPTYEYLEESDENTPQETMTHVIYVMDNTIQEINRGDLRQLVEMTKEDAQSLRQLVDGVEWTEGTSDCLSDWALNLGGHLIYYHSECGTFNEPNLYTMSTISSKEPENVGRCYSLTEEEQDLVESLLKKYISLGSRDE